MSKTSIKKKFRFKHDWWGYVFIAPFFIIFAIFQLYPMIMSFVYAFTDFDGANAVFDPFQGKEVVSYSFVGLQTFKQLFGMRNFWMSLYNTAFIWSINFVPQLVIALLFAAMFTSARFRLRGKGAFKVMYFLPNILTAASIALLFKLLFEKSAGPMDRLFRDLGWFETEPFYDMFSDPIATKLLVSFIQFWRYFGHSMIILAAGMLGINPTLYEAAEVDGATKIRQFFSITIPSLKPILLYSLVTSLVGGLQIFEIPLLLNDGGPRLGGYNGSETISMFIYNQSLKYTSAKYYALSSAASVFLFFVSVACSLLLFMLMKDREPKELKVKGLKKGVK